MSPLFRFNTFSIVKLAILSIFLIFQSTTVLAASVTLAWDRPDSSAVAGYHIYYGTGPDYKNSPGKTIDAASQTQCIIDNLVPGTVYFFAATSHDGNGAESDFSKEISYEVAAHLSRVAVAVKPGETGTIRVSPGDAKCRDNCGIDFETGSSPVLSMEPDPGYRVSDVQVNGSSVGPVSSYTFEDISGDQAIAVHFSFKEYTITASAGTGGSIVPDGERTIAHGDSASYIIAADDGNEIADVIVNGHSVGPVGHYTVSSAASNVSIYARFHVYKEPVAGSEIPPDTPILTGSAVNAAFAPGEPVLLEADIYSHPEGNMHYKSRWQIRRVDEKKPFYDIISDIDLTAHELTVPFDSGLKYAWRVGFQDIMSTLTAWSDEATFIVGEKTLQDQNPPLSPGRNRNHYEMVSFNHWPMDPCSTKVFGPLLTRDYSSGDYSILAYDPHSTWKPHPSWNGGYREYGDFDVVPGRSYLVLARHGMDLTMEGVSVAIDSDIFVELDYNLSNDDGWTMIAVPNNADYYWGDLEIRVHGENGDIQYGPIPIRQLSESNPYIDTQLWEVKNRPDIQHAIDNSKNYRMMPHGGYWVRARAENVTLCFPFDQQAGK